MAAREIAVIGGGLIGLATAWALLRRSGTELHVTLYEKEADVGRHQSTHNSGVLHSGLYYAPGSLKAQLARSGLRTMTRFCEEHDIPHEICGKLVVATTEAELPRLAALLERGQQNGLRGLRWLEPEAVRELEPHVRCRAALQVPEEGIVDFRRVCDVLAAWLRARGCVIRTGTFVTRLEPDRGGWRIGTRDGDAHADLVANCAAQNVDRLAASAGHRPSCRIVPFRGEYFALRPERRDLVNHLVYPVPDPAFPFLGVHFTRTIDGRRDAGPNAVLAFSREGYRFSDVNAADVRDMLTWPGFWRFVRRHPRTVARELGQSLSRARFVGALQRLIPEISEADLLPGGSGVRVQPLYADGRLAQDFIFLEAPGAVHVLSAPSPAATAALAIGERIAHRVLSNAGPAPEGGSTVERV
jgi:L-2-hydroxyglutarate oxidase